MCVYTLEAQMYRVTTSSNHYRHEPQTSYSCHSLAWRRACIHDPIIAFKRKINEGGGGNKKEKKERKRDKRNLKMWIAGTIGVHLAGNVQKISLHLYKNEQGLIMERAVRLNSTSLKAKRVRMFQTVTWFLFFPLFSFLLFPSLSYFFILFFFFNTTSPFAIGSTKNCGTCTALFMTHRLLPLCLVNRWIKTFPSRAISDVRFSLSLSFFSVIICLHWCSTNYTLLLAPIMERVQYKPCNLTLNCSVFRWKSCSSFESLSDQFGCNIRLLKFESISGWMLKLNCAFVRDRQGEG